MWLTIAERRALPPRLCTQPGCCECQASAWPRTRCPLAWAVLTIRSPLVNVNEPWDGSVATHFISFSGVTMVNSRLRIPVYVLSPSLPADTAVPKYRPVAAADAPSVVAAPADVATATTAPSAAVP